MWPLGLLSATLMGLILLAWWQTSEGFFGFRSSRWMDTPLTGEFEALLSRTEPLPQAVLEQRIQAVEGAILRWIQYLNVIATVAPMVGLLGTVSGMIGAFQTIATGGMGKPELLAGDIGEALITTATGLTIGIPAMVFFFILRNRLDGRLEQLESWLENKRPSEAKGASGLAGDR